MPIVSATLDQITATEAIWKVQHTADGRAGTTLEFEIGLTWSVYPTNSPTPPKGPARPTREFSVRWPQPAPGARPRGESQAEAVGNAARWFTRMGEALQVLLEHNVFPEDSGATVLHVCAATQTIVYGREPS